MVGLIAQHLKPGTWFKVRDEVGDGAFRRLAQKVDLELLARLAKSDCLGREPGRFDCAAMDWFLERARPLGVEHRPPGPILLGRHLLELGLKPGPRVGEILKAVYEQQLDGTVTTLDEAVAAARRCAQPLIATLQSASAGPQPDLPLYNPTLMARYTLVYGVRLVPEGIASPALEDADARRSPTGRTPASTLHTIDGTIPQLRRALDRSLDAFFDLSAAEPTKTIWRVFGD